MWPERHHHCRPIQLYPEEFYENGLKIITVPIAGSTPPLYLCRQELELPEQHSGEDRGQRVGFQEA